MDRYMFRGKRLRNSEWVYGYLAYENYNEYNGWWISNGNGGTDMVDPLTIGQCTGIKDKNGNLIYRTDIARDEFCREFVIDYSDHFQRLHLYPYNEKAINEFEHYKDIGVQIFDWIYPEIMLEIIGNIHDKDK